MNTILAERIGGVAYQLLTNAGVRYPRNYLDKLIQHLKAETDSGARSVLTSIVRNIVDAAVESAALCQDTGVPVFHIYLNSGITIKGDLEAALIDATANATEDVPIRKNVIEPFTFENPGTNTGWGVPFIHYHYGSQPGPLRIRAELKGFGGEIKSTSDWIFTSTENMEDAVLSYVLHNVMLSKGEGCMPGLIGVGVGGYAGDAGSNAKNAVFRELTEKQPDLSDGGPMQRLEKRIYRCVNRLGLGPMGGGGDTTTLGVYLEPRGTHTAVAPVSVCNQCWASRGSEALVTENSIDYITPHIEKEDLPGLNLVLAEEVSKPQTGGNVYRLDTPVPLEDIQRLRVGDVVYLNGTISTARDGGHRRMIDLIQSGEVEKIPQEILEHRCIYHMGPVVSQEGDGWCIKAAGPTTSSRFTDDSAFLIEKGVINFIIGKGTMGSKTIHALKGRGVYLKAVGGCAVTYKRSIIQNRVTWLDLGFPEAAWIMTVKDFGPLVVGIDAMGNSLAENVMETVYDNAREIYREEGLDPQKRYVQYPQTVAGLSLEELIQKG